MTHTTLFIRTTLILLIAGSFTAFGQTKIKKDNSMEMPTPTPFVEIAKMVKPSASVDSVGSTSEVSTRNFKVVAKANENPVITVKLAKRGVVLIDFPSDDPVYKIYPGAESFVYVGCVGRTDSGFCNNSKNDAIVLRPGDNFHALGNDDAVSTIVTIQRESGMVATIIVVPADSVTQNTNYVSVEYSPTDVVAYRKTAGLPFNLTPIKETGVSIEVADESVSKSEGDGEENVTSKETELTPKEILQNELVQTLQKNVNPETVESLDFQKPVYGLSLARMPVYQSRVKDVTIEVIAVRNTLNLPVRLMPNQPQLVIADKNDKKRLINIKTLPILHTVTTVSEGDVIEPGKIYYYAFAYESPIMSVSQELQINVARREAEDQPATISLSSARKR